MELLKALIWTMRILAGLTIVIAILGFTPLLTPVSKTKLESPYNFSTVLMTLVVGVVWLIVASGLSKRKKWAWYLGVITFTYSIVHNFIIRSSVNLIAGIIGIILLAILVKEKKVIFKQ